ncbi:MAG: hypothetical protein R3E03_02255 [Novosphingobium sp.]
MDAIVAEREANGAFASLEDLFRRVPYGSMNRRQLEGLAGAGAFDAIEPNRAQVLANADILLAVADEAERTRTSGQHGLFGGEDHAALCAAAGRCRAVEPGRRWPASARTSVSISPPTRSSNGARWHRATARAPMPALMESGVPGGGRLPAVMAAMVEGVQRRKTRRGADFVMADFSDSSGQFSASCFEDRWSNRWCNGRAGNLRAASGGA